MSQSNQDPEWTIGGLYRHFKELREDDLRLNDVRFAAQESATNAAMESARTAVIKAEAATEKRFEAGNKFRDSLDDQQRTFMPRKEAESEMNNVKTEIRTLRELLVKQTGQSTGMSQAWVWLIGAVSLVSLLLGISSHFKQ